MLDWLFSDVEENSFIILQVQNVVAYANSYSEADGFSCCT